VGENKARRGHQQEFTGCDPWMKGGTMEPKDSDCTYLIFPGCCGNKVFQSP